MALRLQVTERTSNVIPMRQTSLPVEVGDDVAPEPSQVYSLIVLTLLLHWPRPHHACSGCGKPWPCHQVRLAFRLLAGD